MADREQQGTESTPRATQAEGRSETQTRTETQGRGETGRGTSTAQRSRRSEGNGEGQRSEGNGGAQASSTLGEQTGGGSQTTTGAQATGTQSGGRQTTYGGGESSQEEGTERQPRYGFFYASAMRRISTSPRRHGSAGSRGWEGQERGQGDIGTSRRYQQSGFGQSGSGQERFGRGEYGQQGYGQSGHGQSEFTQGGAEGGYRHGGVEGGRRGESRGGEWQGGPSQFGQHGGLGTSSGFSEGSFGQGGGLGSRGAYGSQYIRGTGGQTAEQLGYGRGSELGTSGFDVEGGLRGGYTGGEWEQQRGQGGWSSAGRQEGRESFGERRLQDRDFGTGSRGERGFGGRGQTGQEFGRREGGREQWRERRGSEQPWSGIGLEDPFESRAGYGLETERPGRRTRWQREPITAGEVMTRDVKAVTKQSTLQNVAQIMKDENCGIVPIVDEDHKLQGLVTDRDLVIRTLAGDRSPLEVKVEDVMTTDVHAVTPDEGLRDVIELMGSKQIRRIAVVDEDDRLVGIISMGDIANRADYDEDLQDALENISSKRSFWSRLWS